MEGIRPGLTRSDWLLPAALAALGVAEVFTVDGLPRWPAIVSVVVPCLPAGGTPSVPARLCDGRGR